MRLKILGSSSAGNAYILENDNEALLIECGVKFSLIKQAVNFNISKIKSCLISHDHQDHCKSVKDVMKAGINVYASAGTGAAMKVKDHHRFNTMLCGVVYQVGGFKVMPFDVKHDAADPVGFLINHEETGKVLFLTDSYYVGYTFKGLNNVIVEANYCEKILEEKRLAGTSPEFLRNRVLESHMSITTCKELLKANDLSQVHNVVLIHLSDSNSDAARFKSEVEGCTGKAVHIATPGMIIENFNKTPF